MVSDKVREQWLKRAVRAAKKAMGVKRRRFSVLEDTLNWGPRKHTRFDFGRRTFVWGAIGAGLAFGTVVAPSRSDAVGLMFVKGKASGPISGTIGPSVFWNGTAGSGYQGSPPVDPTRVNGKPAIRLTFPDKQRFTSNQTLGVAADAGGKNGTQGLSKVRVYCEGNTLDVTASTWRSYTDTNGSPRLLFDWNFVLDVAGAQAAHADGTLQLYFQAYANDNTLENRVIGPYTVRVSATQFDGTILCGVGQTKTTIKAALEQAKTNGWNWPQIVLTDTAVYPMNTVASTLSTAVGWAVITPAQTATFTGYVTNGVLTVLPGLTGAVNVGDAICGNGIWMNSTVAAYGTNSTTGTGGAGTYQLVAGSYSDTTFPSETIGNAGATLAFTATRSPTLGDYSNNFTNMHYDGLCYRGAGMRVDHARLAYGLGAIFVNPTAVPNGLPPNGNTTSGYFWLDGVDLFCGQTTATPATGFTFGAGGWATFCGLLAPGFWVTSSGTSGNPNVCAGFYCTDMFKHDMSYGILFAQLTRNCLIDRSSSQGIEDVMCNIHCTILRNGPYYSGVRLPRNALTITYLGTGTVIQFQKTASNAGQGGTLNIYVDNSTPTFSLNYVVGTSATRLSDVVTWVNSLPNFSATLQDSTDRNNASCLSVADLVPSAAITKRSLVVGQPFQLITIADQHTDADIQQDPTENVIHQFFQNYLMVGGQAIFTEASCTDLIYQNLIFGPDVSTSFVLGTCTATISGSVMTVTSSTVPVQSFSSATVISGAGVMANTQITSQTAPDTGHPGETWGGPGRYNLSASMTVSSPITVTLLLPGPGAMGIGSTNKHAVFRRITQFNDPAHFASDYTGDSYSSFSQNAFESFAYGGGAVQPIWADRNVIRNGNGISPFNQIPSGFTNSTALGGADWSTMYQNVNDNSITGMSPILNGPLKQADGTYAGALNPDGTWNMAA